MCGQWYVWSFPYYLIGITLVGLIPALGASSDPEAWLVLVPMIYLVHFFLGLAEWRPSQTGIGGQPGAQLPRAAQTYLTVVLAAGVMLLTSSALGWQSQNPTRFVIYLALASAASAFKIQLPHLEGTITPSFVLLLVTHYAIELYGNRVYSRFGRIGAGAVASRAASGARPGDVQSGVPGAERGVRLVRKLVSCWFRGWAIP